MPVAAADRRWRALGGRIYVGPSFRMHHFGELDLNQTWDEALAENRAVCGNGQVVTVEELAPAA